MYSPGKGKSTEQEASVLALSLSVQVTGRVSPVSQNRHCTHCGQELHWHISIPELKLSQLPMHRTFPLSPNTPPLVSGRVTSTVVPVKPEVSCTSSCPPKDPTSPTLAAAIKATAPHVQGHPVILSQLMERGNGYVSLYWLWKSCL